MSVGGEQVLAGVTYWSRDQGPYVWHEFDAERMRYDLQAMAAAGVRAVRTLLPWDVFMPDVTRPDAAGMRNFETLLRAAEDVSLRVTPVLFAQTIGDCVMLPPYATDVDAPRRGVRVVSGGVVQPGGPRDQYTDPRMLEAELRWLEGMVGAFAGNPVVAFWDLGHDPATVLRPRRIDDLRRWASMLATRLHAAGERCALTLGAGDVTTARGVRLDAVTGSVDALGLAVDAGDLGFARGTLGAGPFAFLVQLALRLAGRTTSLHAHAGLSHDGEPDGDAAAGLARDIVDRLLAVGCSGLHAPAWSDCSERVEQLAPFDRRPQLARMGLVDAAGETTAFGGAWLTSVSAVGEARSPAPWPDSIETSDYYANLPHSIEDLYAAWQRLVDD